MNDEKKTILSKITPGNVITIVIVLVGIITAWAQMNEHLKDDSLHINDGEVVLTQEEFKNLLNFAAIVDKEIKGIGENRKALIEIEKEDAVHFREFQFLYEEHESLEGKVSRIYKELKDEINEIDN